MEGGINDVVWSGLGRLLDTAEGATHGVLVFSCRDVI